MYDSLFRLVSDLNLKDHVRFTEFVPGDELPLWYNGADLFALPSAYEGFGFPLVEAMACGVPAIVSTTNSLAEISAGAALTAETGSAEALQMQIMNVLDAPDRARALRQAGLDRARTFDWMETARATLRVYQQAYSESAL